MPEFDREGWAVCLFWLQGGKHNETPTDKKKLVRKRIPLGDFRLPPPFRRKEGPRETTPNSIKQIEQDTNLGG